MKHIYTKRLFIFLSIFSILLTAKEQPKFVLMANSNVQYNIPIKDVSTFDALFKEGTFYGRLRTNNFYYISNHENEKLQNHFLSAIGGSFVFKSASFHGISFNTGLYASHAFFNESTLNSIGNLKSSKDALDRLAYVNGGSQGLYTFAQANINYKYQKTDITMGRQLIESFYAKSNDSKMIPNSFDGIVIASKALKKTTLKFAYLVQQKLRHHKNAHSVLMYGDENSSQTLNNPQWSQNDDSAMHRGLTYSALKALGKPTHAPLILLDIKNKSIENLKLNFASYSVPQLISQIMGEAYYRFNFDGFSIASGFRYLQQFDNGAGEVGGASLSTKGLSGYKNPNSLDSKLIATRIVTRFKDYKINLAYTNILDEADLVTPWRAFPTSGYTRSMGIYNWKANTKSYRLEVVKNADKNGDYETPFIQTSILYIDGDIKKSDTQSMYYYFAILQNIPILPSLQYKFRVGFRDFIGDSSEKSDYIDTRLEFNYLF